MSLRIKMWGIFFLFAGPMAFSGDSKWNTYNLLKLPKGKLSCSATAREIGDKFEKATGQTIFRASCERESSLDYDIQISYSAAAQVPLVSTTNEQGGMGDLGVYRTMTECETALPAEAATFTRFTGLLPFLSYCYKDSALSKAPYAARIDSFGSAKLFPYRFEDTVYADSIQNAQGVLTALLKATETAGIRVHQVALVPDGGLKIVVRYYNAPGEIGFVSNYLRMDQAARYSSAGTRKPLEACNAQLKDLEQGFSQSYSTQGIWFCGWDKILFEAKLYVVRIRPQEGVRAETLPDRFLTFQECDSERAHAKSWYEKMFGITPFGVLCSWKTELGTGKPDAFVIKVLIKTPELEPHGGFDPDLGFLASNLMERTPHEN